MIAKPVERLRRAALRFEEILPAYMKRKASASEIADGWRSTRTSTWWPLRNWRSCGRPRGGAS